MGNWDEEYDKYLKEVAAIAEVGVFNVPHSTKTGAVEQLEEARGLIVEALTLIREATDEDPNVEAYLCAPLSDIVGEGEYRTHNLTIERVIRGLKE